MKKRLVIAVLLIFAVLTGLCACGSEEKKPEEKIKDEIAEAYELDDAGEKLVSDLFAEFDSAFEKLKKPVEDKDLYEYAEAVAAAFSDFKDIFSEKYETKLQEKIDNASGDELSEYALIFSDFVFISIDVGWSKLSFISGYDGESGERLAEDAFGYVNKLSDFFYGVDRITDDDLDPLA